MSTMSCLRNKLVEIKDARIKKHPSTNGNHSTFIGSPITFTLMKIRRRNARLERRDRFRKTKLA